MKYISGESGPNMFDGPFKVPLPKKTSAFSPSSKSGSNKIRAPQPKYRGIDKKYSSFVYQKLLGKLQQTPENMTKFDMKVLSTHPVIRKLLKASKEGNDTNRNFYVPIDSLLNPELYKDSHVPVLVESCVGEQKSDISNQNGTTENISEDISDETTNSNSDSEEYQESRVGFYTAKERQEKILRYKAKLQKYREGKVGRKNVTNRKNSRLVSQNQPRKNGRFASYPDVTDDILKMIQDGDQGVGSSHPVQASQFSVNEESQDLNEIVSQII